jgi:hypothetical protein
MVSPEHRGLEYHQHNAREHRVQPWPPEPAGFGDRLVGPHARGRRRGQALVEWDSRGDVESAAGSRPGVQLAAVVPAP